VDGTGIREMAQAEGTPKASVALGQDSLEGAETLQEYISRQKGLILNYLKGASIAGPQASSFAGSDEAFLVIYRHLSPDGVSILQAQTYVRSGTWVGIITLTAGESRLSTIKPAYEGFLRGLNIKVAPLKQVNRAESPSLAREGGR